MVQLFLNLLNISITASWIVLAVVLLRFLLKKSPKWIICLLWIIVGLRLVMPFSLESVFSLLPDQVAINTNTHRAQTGIDPIDNAINNYLGTSFDPVPDYSIMDTPEIHAPVPEKKTDPLVTISSIWVAGMAMMTIYSLLSWLLLRRKVQESIPYQNNIYLCDHVDSAFVLGMIRPRIYLSSSFSEEQMGYVINHEQSHLARKDHLWKPLGFMLLTVYWFNPVMWLAYILLCRDIEIACDEKTIRNMDLQEKKNYSNTLLACCIHRRMITACPVAFGEISIKARIKSVANYKKPAFWVIVTALISCIAVAVCFLTDPIETIQAGSYRHAEQEFEKLQAKLESDNAMTDQERFLAYAALFQLISNGAETEAAQFADLARAVTNNSVAFLPTDVFYLAAHYADAFTELAAGKKPGIQDVHLGIPSFSSLPVKFDYLEDLKYHVKMINIGDPWYLDPNTDGSVPYNGEIGNYLVEITFYDLQITSELKEKYPVGTHVLGSAKPGSHDIILKHLVTADHSHRFYIGSNMPFHVDEQAVTEAPLPIGTVSVSLLHKPIVGQYNNMRSVVFSENFTYYVEYQDLTSGKFLKTEDAHARFAVDNAEIKRALEAYINELYQSGNTPSVLEYAEKTLSNENIDACQLFCTEDGKLMILAKIYMEGIKAAPQRLIPLAA